MNGVMGSIVEVNAVDQKSIDATIYELGTNVNETYSVAYADLTPEQKTIVDNFRQLIIDLAPSNNP